MPRVLRIHFTSTVFNACIVTTVLTVSSACSNNFTGSPETDTMTSATATSGDFSVATSTTSPVTTGPGSAASASTTTSLGVQSSGSTASETVAQTTSNPDSLASSVSEQPATGDVTSAPPGGTVTAASSTAGTSDGTTSEVPGEPEVRFIGRFVHDGEQASFAWSGSGIVAAFTGTEVSVQLDDGGNNQFTVVVDGQVQPVLITQSGSQAYPLAQGLPAGRHEVEVYRRTEASVGATTFEGFIFGAQGTLDAPPPPKVRRLEVIGDSISCGYGNEGADTSCTFSEDTENHYLTYGAIAARTLDAELTTVAWSGKGVVNNYDTDTTKPMPALYGLTLPDDANSGWDFSVKPHAVVINLGTNDFSTDGDPTTEQFRDGYVGLVEQVRAGAPDAFILCTVGNMLSGADLDAARAGIHAAVDTLQAAGDDNIAAWDMDVPNDDPGCDWHPKVATHELMAAALVTELEQHLGW